MRDPRSKINPMFFGDERVSTSLKLSRKVRWMLKVIQSSTGKTMSDIVEESVKRTYGPAFYDFSRVIEKNGLKEVFNL